MTSRIIRPLVAALTVAVGGAFAATVVAGPATAATVTITPGTPWTDTAGNRLQAHGAGVFTAGGSY